MNDAWAVVAAALGSALLSVGGTFWLERWRVARAERQAILDRLRDACARLSASALSSILRAQALYLTGVFRSGIGEGLDVVLYHRKPVDPIELMDWLATDIRKMLDAQVVIELSGDEELIRSATELILATNAVMEKGGALTKSRERETGGSWTERVGSWTRNLVPLKRDPEVEGAIHKATRDLARVAREFASVSRRRLGIGDPNAVIRAFPGLFSPESTTDHAGVSSNAKGANVDDE